MIKGKVKRRKWESAGLSRFRRQRGGAPARLRGRNIPGTRRGGFVISFRPPAEFLYSARDSCARHAPRARPHDKEFEGGRRTDATT